MKVLIIDDNIFKQNDIKRALDWNDIRDIDFAKYMDEALEKIRKNNYNLIITDMHYPLERGVDSDIEAGYKLIKTLKEENINIPIIICSSQNWSSPDTLGTVWYNKSRDLNWDFKNILTKL